MCRDGVGWDDPIPDVIMIRWEKWRGELPILQRLSIPRCFKPENFGPVVKKELHHFSDASTRGYWQYSYLRLQDDCGRIHCSFVAGKSRVTPLKPVRIPRLELQAAVTSLKVSRQIRQELSVNDVPEFFWSDSKVVLGYIANESRRFHVFVANRVQLIHDASSVDQWTYVESKSNPADEASRGLSPSTLLTSKWLKGPTFLWQVEDKWPFGRNEDMLESCEVLPSDPDVKKAIVLTTMATKKELKIADRLDYFSDWFRAKRAIAFSWLYLCKLREKISVECKGSNNPTIQQESRSRTTIQVGDLQRAENVIVRSVQSAAFPEELKSLRSTQDFQSSGERSTARERKGRLKNFSPLLKLDPFCDAEGVLRVGGRLANSSLPFEMKFPVILPRRSHVTTLIIKYFHDKIRHQGRGMTLNEVRANGYWIVGGTIALGSYIWRCHLALWHYKAFAFMSKLSTLLG